MAEGSVLKKQTKPDLLRRWINKQGRSVWEKKTFCKVADPKEILVKGFEEYIDKHKFSIHKESKVSVYVWGSWYAIGDLTEDLRELRQESEATISDLKSQLKICSQEWADQVEKLRQEKQNVERQFGELQARAALEKNQLMQELELCRQNVGSEKACLIQELQVLKRNAMERETEMSQALREARDKLLECQEDKESLKKQLAMSESTAAYLVSQASQKLDSVSHVKCQQRIQELEERLKIKTGIVAAVKNAHVDPVVTQALLAPVCACDGSGKKQEAAPFVIEGGTHLATSGNQSNIALIKTKQVARVTDDGSVQKERILESRVFKPSELLSISKQLGELNKSTAVSWIAKVWKRFDSLTGQDLTELARACLRPEDLATFEMEMDSVSADETDMKEWMLALLAVFFPGKSISRLFSNEVQSTHEYPETYLQRKLVLGMLSGDAPEGDEERQGEEEEEFDEEKHSAFIASLLEGLLPEIRLAMVPFNCRGIRYQEFVSAVRKVARIMRETGQSNVKRRERAQKEPIDTIQVAPQAAPRRFQSANERRQQGFGQGSQNQQSQYQQPASQWQRQEQGLRNQIWNALKQAGFDMKDFDKKPDHVLLEAYGNWKQGAGAACAQPMLPAANGLFVPPTQFPINGATAPSAPPLQVPPLQVQ